MPVPNDYIERVYAGVLGKLIGVYLGRPFEGWSHQRIVEELGEIDGYVHERFGVPLIVTDDDIAGTFTFLRALEDNEFDPNLSPAQIGEAWLNYLIEMQTVLWWGGIGNSTEHTAYLRLKSGIPAPDSGSIAVNGKTIAEQIGSQIFIDGWAMLFPGDPERAVDFARRAASVSHDGEAIYGAQVVAALEAQAFVERDINALLDTAVSLIPLDSTIARLIHDIREWHAAEQDWYANRSKIEVDYGYDTYRGNCHMVPNHALIIHSLLHGNDDFQRSLMIVNTSGWDTDCNSGNVGAILGIKNGLAGIDTSPVHWRGPVADRMYLSTADGGRAITDAATESIRIVDANRALRGEDPLKFKDGARFHFSLPGSVQGFQADDEQAIEVANDDRHLALTLTTDSPASARVLTFTPLEAMNLRSYTLFASPTLYSGQTVVTELAASPSNTSATRTTMFLRYYGEDDSLEEIQGPGIELTAGESGTLTWAIPGIDGAPIAHLGFTVAGERDATVLIDRIDWRGAPVVTLSRPRADGSMWRHAWVKGVDQWEARWSDDYRIVQNRGIGLISQGTEDWTDYAAQITATIPLATTAGIAVRVGGLRRFYALVIGQEGHARLVKAKDGTTVLADTPFDWDPDQAYTLELAVKGNTLRGSIDGEVLLEAVDTDRPFHGGGVGLVVEEGTLAGGPVNVKAL